MQRFNLIHGEFVVAADHDFRAQLAEILHEVVGKGIVVVEHEDHGEFQCSAEAQAVAPDGAVLQDWLWLRAMVLHFLVQGRVQGVGFRWFVHREASELALRGWVRNTEEGDVEVVASGSAEDLDELRRSLRRGPRGSRVDRLIEHYLDEAEAGELESFRIEGAW